MYEFDEAMLWFLHDNDDVYQKFCHVNETEDVSIAEFVLNYERDRFHEYCGVKGWITD